MAHGRASTRSSDAPAPERLDAEALRRWIRRAAASLEQARTAINALNVFPVADRDTGTNMLVTIRSAAALVEETGAATPFGIVDAAATGALSAACGSSGVILASYLRGFAAALGSRPETDGTTLAAALEAAADAAHSAVSEPVDGTILSVARAAARAARDRAAAPVAPVACAAAAAARMELANTTSQLPALAAADVVDAGGQGLVVVLDALGDVATGTNTGVRPVADAGSVGAGESSTAPRFGYEVQLLLDAPSNVVPTLRMRLEQLGDSVAIVSGDGRHNVHVHVNDVGAAIEAAVDLGRPSQIRVTHFADQMSSCAD